MGKSAFADRGFFVGLLASGLLTVVLLGLALSARTEDTVACAPSQATPSSPMAARPSIHSDDSGYGNEQSRLLADAQSAPEGASDLLPTLPPLTGLPTVPVIETLIAETPELSLPTAELPALPTVPPILSTSAPAPSATPTATVTPAASDAEPNRQRLLLLGGIGAALLCGGGVVAAGVLLILLRRRRKPAARADAAPAPVPEAKPMLVAPGVDPIALRAGVTTIGRHDENDIIIEDKEVSRYHARIECAGDVCTFEDLQSSNGSFVNGERVSRTVLTPGDQLRIGNVQMTYHGPQVQRPNAWLEVMGERYPLRDTALTIGRSAENAIHLADPVASRKHARIEPRQGAYALIDLGSANGTFVNGERVQQHLLQGGDEIRVGSTRITFHSQARR